MIQAKPQTARQPHAGKTNIISQYLSKLDPRDKHLLCYKRLRKLEAKLQIASGAKQILRGAVVVKVKGHSMVSTLECTTLRWKFSIPGARLKALLTSAWPAKISAKSSSLVRCSPRRNCRMSTIAMRIGGNLQRSMSETETMLRSNKVAAEPKAAKGHDTEAPETCLFAAPHRSQPIWLL